MSPYKEVNLHPTRSDRLSFGAIVLVGAAALGAVQRLALDRPDAARALWIGGGILFVLSFVPWVGRMLYIGWMYLGVTLGLVMSPIFLLVLYVLLIVPAGLLLRLRRTDPMRRARSGSAPTYWEDYPSTQDPALYTRQF